MEKYKLQRKQIQGKLIKPLLTNLKRLCAGVMIATTFMLGGCTSVLTEQESYAICYYECTQENGDLVKLVGYRSSYSPDDTGYNYVYNILDGQIYYIGEHSEDCFTDVLECTIEDAGNISIEEIIELYKINSQEPLYGNKKDKVQTIKRVTPNRK